MAELVYSAITSLDGYVADEAGSFDWAVPDEEVLAHINGMERPLGTYLYGRRMYEQMEGWETSEDYARQSARSAEFAELWQAADKVVYSTTLARPVTERTRIERSFDLDAVRELKSHAAHDMSVGGPELAAHAFHAGLVDECRLYLAPIAVGGGKPALPDGLRVHLELMDERRFANGFVWLRYRVGAGPEVETGVAAADDESEPDIR